MTEFVAYQTASMLQNVSQNRTDKTIKIKDIKNISSAAWLSVYPGTTMFAKNNGHYFGHMPRIAIFCVKGLADGKASCIWRSYCSVTSEANNPDTILFGTELVDDSLNETRVKTNVNPDQIHPRLKIDEGQIKIIIEPQITHRGGKLPSGKNISMKQALGFYLITPTVRKRDNVSSTANHVVIFSPRPGLFSETAPK